MYHCEFNTTQLVWRKVKSYVAIKNKLFTLQEVKWLLPEALVSVTQEDWQNCCAHVERVEGEACEGVNIVDSDIDPVGVDMDEVPSAVPSLFIWNVIWNSDDDGMKESGYCS
ncbi:hypothetical protein HPB47_010548 [Ixodes persulcatus]|uniref:Uncharacterized protein n=1 Tax=Ixodes persulcatus TaxID=34615 RepID=A0AC60R022_IXOPE|nr:hypothetical protein HPB47_010548 [Ixodes persulcatus]